MSRFDCSPRALLLLLAILLAAPPARGAPYTIIGGRERTVVILPAKAGDPLHLSLTAKSDTGAATSSLNALEIQPFQKQGKEYVRFIVPLRGMRYRAEAPVEKIEKVRSSDGEAKARYFIEGKIELGGKPYPILLSLADRSEMKNPLLLGRGFLKEGFLVDSGREFVLGH